MVETLRTLKWHPGWEPKDQSFVSLHLKRLKVGEIPIPS